MKRKTRTFRVRASLDARLIAVARDNGRSVSEEIEHRLEWSFDYTAAWAHGMKIAAEAEAYLREHTELGDQPFATYTDEH
jgi:hypothetical protein